VSRFKGCVDKEKPYLSKWHSGVQLEFAVTHQKPDLFLLFDPIQLNIDLI